MSAFTDTTSSDPKSSPMESQKSSCKNFSSGNISSSKTFNSNNTKTISAKTFSTKSVNTRTSTTLSERKPDTSSRTSSQITVDKEPTGKPKRRPRCSQHRCPVYLNQRPDERSNFSKSESESRVREPKSKSTTESSPVVQSKTSESKTTTPSTTESKTWSESKTPTTTVESKTTSLSESQTPGSKSKSILKSATDTLKSTTLSTITSSSRTETPSTKVTTESTWTFMKSTSESRTETSSKDGLEGISYSKDRTSSNISEESYMTALTHVSDTVASEGKCSPETCRYLLDNESAQDKQDKIDSITTDTYVTPNSYPQSTDDLGTITEEADICGPKHRKCPYIEFSTDTVPQVTSASTVPQVTSASTLPQVTSSSTVPQETSTSTRKTTEPSIQTLLQASSNTTEKESVAEPSVEEIEEEEDEEEIAQITCTCPPYTSSEETSKTSTEPCSCEVLPKTFENAQIQTDPLPCPAETCGRKCENWKYIFKLNDDDKKKLGLAIDTFKELVKDKSEYNLLFGKKCRYYTRRRFGITLDQYFGKGLAAALQKAEKAEAQKPRGFGTEGLNVGEEGGEPIEDLEDVSERSVPTELSVPTDTKETEETISELSATTEIKANLPEDTAEVESEHNLITFYSN